ncbi:MAG: gfo/Idh/MocA family oxidoreductase [Stygiobacter sp.]|nr:MAG: gfo/Idh/MocA family oxidoreductase [Stygiobacter sp.]
MKNFAITGVAGYIAPRHLKAIKDTGNRLVAAVDPHDSVGILDQFCPETAFFTEFERFDRHLEKLRKGATENRVDYVSICSPNNLHDAHIRQALRIGADSICEKPLVLNPWNLDALAELEREHGKKVYTILQLRVHPALIELKRKIDTERHTRKTKHEVVLTYITSRGLWYDFSWKGDPKKSGGVATNIGVHFFDLLGWFFGKVVEYEVYLNEPKKMAGFLELENANVKWYLSIDKEDLPKEICELKKTTFRSITIDENEVEFTEGFTNLHTTVYEKTLTGEGFGIEDARGSIELVQNIRYASIINCPDQDKVHKNLKF